MLKNLVCIALCGLMSTGAWGQFFASGSWGWGFKNLKTLNEIVTEFNERENHQIGAFKSLTGFQFSVGHLGKVELLELSFGNQHRRRQSYTPNQLKENAEVLVNFAAITAHIGLRLIPKRHLFAGIGVNFGQNRYRYSFGGDYIIPVRQYALAPEIFAEYGFKVRFLVKKEQRNETFYLFRIRPFYQAHFPSDLKPFQEQLNPNPNPPLRAWDENLSNFGFRVSLLVPFGKMPAYALESPQPKPKRDKKKFEMGY